MFELNDPPRQADFALAQSMTFAEWIGDLIVTHGETLVQATDRLAQPFAAPVELMSSVVDNIHTSFADHNDELIDTAVCVQNFMAHAQAAPYEEILIKAGVETKSARIQTNYIMMIANRETQRRNTRKNGIKPVIRKLGTPGATTLVISRLSRKLSALLDDEGAADLVTSALFACCRTEFVDQYKLIVEAAVRRDVVACRKVAELAQSLVAHIPDSRGKTISRATVAHWLMLRALALAGKVQRFTYNVAAECHVDALTKATEAVFRVARFDPRPATRLLR
jgi:hypothetical protein